MSISSTYHHISLYTHPLQHHFCNTYLCVESTGGIYAMERPHFNSSFNSRACHRTSFKEEIVDCPTPKWVRWWIIRTAINNPTLPTAS